MPKPENLPFWRRKTLKEMTSEEWEALCDGCGKCCLVLLEDEESGAVYETSAACRLFDSATCRCVDYERRHALAPQCVRLTPETVSELAWMPPTCAYRLIAEGRPLYDWHPLVSGDPKSVHRDGPSVRRRTVSEDDVEEEALIDHIVAVRIAAWEEASK
ncbi:MAG: YcgN family cysteine cluster protein [Pseudomonadota bacterium]